MKEIVGVSLSRFHDSEDQFEFLIAYADGREIGHEVSRRAALAIQEELNRNLDLKTPPPQAPLRGIVPAFEAAYPELYYHIAKGKISAGEPLYGAIITTTGATEIGHGESYISADDALRIAIEGAGLTVPAIAATDDLTEQRDRALRQAETQWVGWVKADCRVRELEDAIRLAIKGINRADPDVLTDTLWMPDDVLIGATVVDVLEGALTPSPQPNMRGRPDGHCADDAAWDEFSKSYGDRTRADLCKGDMTDFALANAQFMCDRNSLDLIVYQTAAKERIRWLSIQLARALATTEGSTDA